MEKRRLGKSGIVVTDLCFGTMTFGSSNTEKEAFELLDIAYHAGIDFFDTAEIYPVPPDAKWITRTEEIVGKWLKTKPRESVILATKVAGPSHGWFAPPIRSGKTALDRRNIRVAIEGSLKRLQTDYIDLYQTHWPDPDAGYGEILETLTELQEDGLVRIFGSSNENTYGTMQAIHTAEKLGTSRYETIQNNYSILNRRDEDELANACRREQISLLSYSPLAGGVCSGKYNGGKTPEGARFSAYLTEGGERQKRMAHRFVNDKSLQTVEKLGIIAQDARLDLVPLCLAWSRQNDFVASTIFGARNPEQLNECLKAKDLIIPQDVMDKIDELSKEIMYPMG